MEARTLLATLTLICSIGLSAAQYSLFSWANPLLPFVALPAFGLGLGLTAGLSGRAPGLRPIPPPVRIAPGPFFAPAPHPPFGAYMPPQQYGRPLGYAGFGPLPVYPRKFNFF